VSQTAWTSGCCCRAEDEGKTTQRHKQEDRGDAAGVTVLQLQAQANAQTDVAVAQKMHAAKNWVDHAIKTCTPRSIRETQSHRGKFPSG